MNAFSTAATLTVLAATTVALGTQTQAQPSTQIRAEPNAAPTPYQHQDSGVFGPFSEGSAKSDAAGCQPKREAMKDAASSTAFAATAAQDGMVEVALAGLALRKSHTNQVRQFAQKMVQDYARANTELDSIVKCEGLVLPTELDAKHNASIKRLDSKSGSAFDKAYLRHMAEKHSDAVPLFQSASRSGDPDVAAFARKSLAMLQEHQQLAENLRAVIGTTVASTQ